MKVKTKNYISLIINVLIVFFTYIALMKFYTSVGDGNMQVSGTSSLRYFTNLSNLFVAVAAAVMIPFNIKNIKKGSNVFPKTVFLLKFASTVSVTVTLLTVVVFLGPITALSFMNFGMNFFVGYTFMFRGNTFYLHFLTPIIAIISVLFFEKTHDFKKKALLLGLLPTILYGIVYAIMVVVIEEANGGWPDFYHFTFGGKLFMAPVSACAMVLATWLISKAEWKINTGINSAKEK